MLALALLLQVEAAPAGLELRWKAPAGCPDRAAVTAMVAGLVRPGEVEAEATVVDARVVRAGSGWALRLSLASARGRDQRSVRAADCQALARTTALVVAIHLDPLAVERALAAGLPGEASAPAPSLPAEAPVVPPAPAGGLVRETGEATAATIGAVTPTSELSEGPESARGDSPLSVAAEGPGAGRAAPADALSEGPAFASGTELSEGPAAELPAPRRVAPRGHLRVDGGLDVGVLPGAGGQAGLFAGVTWPHVRLEAGLVATPLRVAPAEAERPGGRFDRLVAALRVCPGGRARPTVELVVCLGFEAGAIRGLARGVAVPAPEWAPWLGVTAGPGVRWRVAGPLGLWFGVDGQLALGRPRFTAGGGEVLQAGRAGVRASFGLDLQFGPRKR